MPLPNTNTEDPEPHFVATAGPAIWYASTPDSSGPGQSVQRIDLDAPADHRERAICRSLLHHALALLDATEPTRTAPRGATAERRG